MIWAYNLKNGGFSPISDSLSTHFENIYNVASYADDKGDSRNYNH